MAGVKKLLYMVVWIFISSFIILMYIDLPFKRNIYIISDLLSIREERSMVDESTFDRKDLPWWQKYFCDLRHEKNFRNRKGIEILDVLQRDVIPDKKANNIFFIETSCKLYPKLRDLCAIESWAKYHPKSTVWYVLNTPHVYDMFGHLGRVRDIYPNIKLVGVDLDLVFRDTPLQGLFESKKWMSDDSLAGQQLGNILRLALVWRFGGTYSDTDVVCLKDTSSLHNALGFIDDEYLNNSHLQGNSPRLDFYWKFMVYVATNFKMVPWGYNGPFAATKVALQYCNLKSLAERRLNSTISLTCGEMNFLSEEVFNTVYFGFANELYEGNQGSYFDLNFNSSFGIHFWNKASHTFEVGKNSHYEVAAKRSCPITYKLSLSPPSF